MNARAETPGAIPAAVTRDESRAVFGQVMGLAAFTLGFLALGASSRGKEQLAVSLLFGLGLLPGLALGPVLSTYAEADPAAVFFLQLFGGSND